MSKQQSKSSKQQQQVRAQVVANVLSPDEMIIREFAMMALDRSSQTQSRLKDVIGRAESLMRDLQELATDAREALAREETEFETTRARIYQARKDPSSVPPVAVSAPTDDDTAHRLVSRVAGKSGMFYSSMHSLHNTLSELSAGEQERTRDERTEQRVWEQVQRMINIVEQISAAQPISAAQHDLDHDQQQQQ